MIYPLRICIGCGREYSPIRRDQKFCCMECREKNFNSNKKGDTCKRCGHIQKCGEGARMVCNLTGQVVIGKGGQGTVHAMKCKLAEANT